MKEELLQLKKDTTEYLQQKTKFQKQRTFFNMKVEEKELERNIEPDSNTDNDAYDKANCLFLCFPNIHDLATKVKEQNPQFSDKRIKNLVIAVLLEEFSNDEDYYYRFANEKFVVDLVEHYYLYEECGYHKIRSQENQLRNLETKLYKSRLIILDQPKQALTKISATAVGIVKPYGEVAKTQLNDAKITTKSLVNKGSKKLIKVLENIVSKTETK